MVAATVVAVLGFAPHALAATFTVGSTADDAGCASPPAGNDCTLRQLIGAAPPGSTILVPAGTYNLTSGALAITQNLSIVGAGARTTSVVQSQSNPDRVFDVQGQSGAPAVVISGLTISGGTANANNGYFGGNIRNAGALTLSEVEITNGATSFGSGAGISNDGGTLTITHSLVDNNGSSSSNDSGGIQNYGDSTVGDAHLTVIDSTIANNTSAQGGGIFSWCGTACDNTTTIIHSTIAFNDGGARASTGGGLRVSAGTMSVANSIVAFNTVDSPFTGAPSNCGTSGTGAITSLGDNLESQADCGFTSAGDLQNSDPQFASTTPQNNGGNTGTLAVAFASPVVDHIASNAAGCSGTDQRDVARPQGSRCDVGAFEFIAPVEGTTPFSGALVVPGCSLSSSPPPSVDWGDGTSSMPTLTQSGALSGDHTYAEEGPKTVVVTWTDDCGPQSRSFQVNVADASLTAVPVSPTVTARAPFNGPVATFTDADPGGTASDYTATIDWGDGAITPGTVSTASGHFVVSGTHTYAAAGLYPTNISISDAGGASAVAQGQAAVHAPPAPVVTGAPVVHGSSGAAFSGSANPDGLATTAHFEYGLDSQYTSPGTSGPVYDHSTSPQPVGSDFSSHPVTASVSGLVPNALYHVRLVAINAAGTTNGPDRTFTTAKAPAPNAPTLGQTFNVAATGLVLIKIHGVFVPLTQLRQIPSGTTINALHGTLTLTTAAPGGTKHGTLSPNAKRKPKTQAGRFGGAVFKVTQIRSGPDKGLANLSIVEGAFKGAPSFASCKAKKGKAVAAVSRRVLQLLHASGKGKFRTKGRYAAATVRGTVWTIADRCDGTLTHAIQHTVTVNDFVRHKTVILRAGRSYLARAGKHK